MVKLGEVAKERRESIKTDKANKPIVGLEHLIPQQVQLTEWSNDADNTFTKLFHKGDVLFGRRRAYLKKASLAPFDGICSGDITVIAPIENKIAPELLPFIIQNDAFFDYAVEKSAGSLSPRVKWEHLKNYEFELPGLDEQRKLAKILWAAEDTKQAYKTLLQKTDDLVKAKFEEMFGNINEASDKNKKTIVEFVDIRDDLRKPLNDATRAEMKSGTLYPYYGAIGCVDYINEYKMDCDAICIAEDCGNYKAGEDSSYIISGKSWVNNHAHVLIPNSDSCLIKFLNFYFKIMDLTKFISGSTRSKLTRGVLEHLPIYLPPLNDQTLFVRILETAEKSKQQLQKSLDSLNATIRALINENLK
ncbi:MAG: restriction endonuclease subunit S [Alphaproteobacteria bacterium]|nr:restriction endonuclease subunit S [Alphaproteobacteria bacterium]